MTELFWFLDASVLLARIDADDSQHAAARELLAGGTALATLDLAFYETANVAVRKWKDDATARKLSRLVSAIADDGGLVRVDERVAADALAIAESHGISVYDAGYVAGAASVGAKLISCDLVDSVNPGLAITPEQAMEQASSSDSA